MDERRKETRKKVMTFVPVYETGASRHLLGYMRDLTLQGALVLGEKHMEPGSQHQLEIHLPNDLPYGALSISARVAHVAADSDMGGYRIGFEFASVDGEQTLIIQTLLERYHFRHNI